MKKFNTVVIYFDEFFLSTKQEALKRIWVSWVNNATAVHKLGCEFMKFIAGCSECRERFEMRRK